MKKKCPIFMLPTEKEGELWKSKGSIDSPNGILTKWGNTAKNSLLGNLYNLYITSDDKIKDGDWYITIRPDYIGKPCKCISVGNKEVVSQLEGSDNINHTQFTELEFAFKIIATTDKELQNDCVAKINLEFIRKFIIKYNEGDIIKEVFVEYSENYLGLPKLNSDANVIITNQIKTEFTLEDIEKAFNAGYNKGYVKADGIESREQYLSKFL